MFNDVKLLKLNLRDYSQLEMLETLIQTSLVLRKKPSRKNEKLKPSDTSENKPDEAFSQM